jgi:hypothetical protein
MLPIKLENSFYDFGLCESMDDLLDDCSTVFSGVAL